MERASAVARPRNGTRANEPAGGAAWLAPAEAIFSLGVRLRGWAYDHGLLAVRRAPCRVVSVGALAAGGAGKTPAAMLVARLLREEGRRVAVLSRGYRGSLERAGGKVSDGERILLDARAAGDEPLLLATRLPGVPVYVGRDRAAQAARAVSEHDTQVLVLDDGFQHRRLARDLDIAIVDGAMALHKERMLPRGPLREPVGALARAGFVLVRGDGAPDTLSCPWARVRDTLSGIMDGATGAPLASEALRGRRVQVVAAIARPERVVAFARAAGADVAAVRLYPDHHAWDAAGLEDSIPIVTTEKDLVRLSPDDRARLRPIVLSHDLVLVEGEDRLRAALRDALGPGAR